MRALRGIVASVAAVVVVTAAIELLKPYVPVLSLAVLYVLAVLPVAVVFGMAYAVPVAVVSMLTFNFFFLPPLYTFTIADSRNWLALLVFVVTAIVVSELAARSRRRAREAELLARIAGSLVESVDLSRIEIEAAQALEAERVRIVLGDAEAAPGAHVLAVGARRVGTIVLERPRRGSGASRRRVLSALASLLAVAIDRERLARDALEAETLRRSDAAKTALLRAVSHDLRSPLMAIVTGAGALAHRDVALDPEDRRELVETILTEAERLDRLVSDLLDLSRLQAGAAEPASEIWTVDDLVVQALDAVGDAAARVEVSLPERPPAVRADLHQLERVLVNLIENALRYSPPAEPVRVQVGATATEVLVRVIDRGPGIPAAELERIFQPFQRGSRSDGAPGAGLGLAIARGFAEANGGRVWAESREGQGATFLFALPVVPAAAEVRV